MVLGKLSGIGLKTLVKGPPEDVLKHVDGIFLALLGVAGCAALGLNLAGITFEANTTLLLTAILFTMLSLNYVLKPVDYERSLSYASFAVIGIGGRYIFNMPIFTSASWADIITFASAMGGLSLVSCAEEAFRAAMTNFFKVLLPERVEEARWILANACWTAYHFIQHEFTWSYALWLFFAAGLPLTYCLKKAGIGSAALAHLVLNMTA